MHIFTDGELRFSSDTATTWEIKTVLGNKVKIGSGRLYLGAPKELEDTIRRKVVLKNEVFGMKIRMYKLKLEQKFGSYIVNL